MKSVYILLILLIYSIALNAQSRDALTVEHQCTTNCLNLTISGQYPPYTVEWQSYDNSTNTFSTVQGWPKSGLSGNDGTEDLCNPTGTQYLVIVYDALCGVVDMYYEVNLCKCKNLDVIIESISNVTACGNYNPEEQTPAYDNCDGNVSVSLNYIGDLSFAWSNGMTGSSISGLCTGSYTVTVTTSDGCSATNVVNICCCNNTSPTFGSYPLCENKPEIIDADILSPTSATAADGSITLITSSTSQSSNILYKWEGPNGYKSNSKNISGLKIGKYCVTLTDGCGSPITKCYELKNCEGTVVSISGNVTNTCKGFAVGAINLNVPVGGTPQYKYLWDNGKKTSSIDNLPQGNFCVTVSDVQGCRGTECFLINNPEPIYERKICKEYWSCNGQIVDTNDIGIKSETKDEFCVSKIICNDERIYTNNNFNGVFYDGNDCRVFTKCKNGTQITLGFGEEYYESIPGCFYRKHCLFYIDDIFFDMSPGLVDKKVWCNGGCAEVEDDAGCNCLLLYVCLLTNQEIKQEWVECEEAESFPKCDEIKPILENRIGRRNNNYFYTENFNFKNTPISKELVIIQEPDSAQFSFVNKNAQKLINNELDKVIFTNKTEFVVSFDAEINDGMNIQILDIYGRIHYSKYSNLFQTKYSIPIEKLIPGMYFVKFSNKAIMNLTYTIFKYN